MQYRQIRNATAIVEYAGTRFLVDPMLSPKDAFPGFEETANEHLRNPLVELPISIEEILAVDVVIVTHTHPDHWDEPAAKAIPKNMTIFAQHEADQKLIQSQGFTDVRILSDSSEFNGIKLIKTAGQHGSDELMVSKWSEMVGEACGVVFKHPAEKTVYLIGDTVWNELVQTSLAKYRPDIVIMNTGDARILGYGSIIMGKRDVLEVHKAVPHAQMIATHMEAINHCVLKRFELREYAVSQGIGKYVHVPEDGDICKF